MWPTTVAADKLRFIRPFFVLLLISLYLFFNLRDSMVNRESNHHPFIFSCLELLTQWNHYFGADQLSDEVN